MKFAKTIIDIFVILLPATSAFSDEMEAIKSIPVGKLDVREFTDSRGMVATFMPNLAEDPNFEPMFKNGFLATVTIANRAFYLVAVNPRILIDCGWGFWNNRKN